MTSKNKEPLTSVSVDTILEALDIAITYKSELEKEQWYTGDSIRVAVWRELYETLTEGGTVRIRSIDE